MNKPFATLTDAIKQWAQVKPAAPALKAPGAEDLSYAMLNQQLDTAADQLAALGYSADHRLALVLPQSILLASCLLTLGSSCAVFPITASLTVPELVKAFKKGDVSAVLVTTADSEPARAAAAECGVPVIELVTADGCHSAQYTLIGSPAAVPASTRMQPDTTAFLISTSGTTGTGKLVPITNRMFADVIALKSEKVRITEHDVTLLTGPLNLISAISSTMFPVIYRGGCVVIDTPYDIIKYFEHIETYQPTWVDVSAPLLHAIYNHLADQPAGAALQRMRFIRVGGAPFPAEMMRTLEAWTGVPVIHAYGMTEGLSGFTSNPLPPGIRKHESVGQVVHGEIALFSDEGKQLSFTETGELGIRSPLIFKGYFNPEDNIPWPFMDGWFLTGDIVTVDSEGYITIIGRRKDMINSGGIKILPNEVEEALALHPDVADACVVPLPHPTLGEQVAAAVARRSEALTVNDLVTYLQTRLAVYKIPAIIHFVDQIPRTSFGKLQRQEVVEQLQTLRSLYPDKQNFDQPATELASEILSLWHEVLGTCDTALTDTFIAAGGDSLTAVRLANLMSEAFSVDFTVMDIFDFPTMLTQAAEINRRRDDNGK